MTIKRSIKKEGNLTGKKVWIPDIYRLKEKIETGRYNSRIDTIYKGHTKIENHDIVLSGEVGSLFFSPFVKGGLLSVTIERRIY